MSTYTVNEDSLLLDGEPVLLLAGLTDIQRNDLCLEYQIQADLPKILLEKPIVTWDTIRSKRKDLITDTDWTQLLDAPISIEEKLAWAEYRQMLRDIPQLFTDPTLVVWPEAPANA